MEWHLFHLSHNSGMHKVMLASNYLRCIYQIFWRNNVCVLTIRELYGTCLRNRRNRILSGMRELTGESHATVICTLIFDQCFFYKN